jgi:Sec-independent protein translocase protein TatA
MFGVGFPEILIIILVIVLFVNPKELPGFFRKFGRLVQQIRDMRESFTRDMKELEKEIMQAAESGSQASVSEEGPGDPGIDSLVIHAQKESLKIRRLICSESAPDAPLSLHICVSTGMGDRIVFQGILHYAIKKSGKQKRIVSATYEVGNRYSVKDYTPRPHEIWTIPWPVYPKELETEIVQKIKGIASSLYPGSKPIEIHDYRFSAQSGNMDDSIDSTELYSYYTNTIAPLGLYPEFSVDPEILMAVRRKLARDVSSFKMRPLIALHSRQRKDLPQKNLLAADILALAVRLKAYQFGLVLFAGREGPIPELEAFCDCKCPLDPSLKEPASILKLCDVFVGGDSGPAHLAAAVGTPVVSLRPSRQDWVNGPFCESDKLACVQGTVVTNGSQPALSFDVEAAVACVFELLDSRKLRSIDT